MFLRDILTATIKKCDFTTLIDCHDPGRTVSGKPNINSGTFNNAEQFSIDVSSKTFNSIDLAKSR